MRSAARSSALACYLGLVPFDPDTLHFDGIVRRHLEIMTGAGIVAGLVYWMIAGRNCRRLARTVAPAAAASAAAVAFQAAIVIASFRDGASASPSDAQFRIGESRDAGFDALHRKE